MIHNYFKIAFRNLVHNKTFSAINIVGLALGMGCSLIIMLWVQDELNKDRFHENDGRLYRVLANQQYAGEINTLPSAPGILAENIVRDIPEIELASQMLWESSIMFAADNIIDKEKGRFVQRDFLKMFSFPLVNGNRETALANPDGLVISQKLANKYFKGQSPIGKTLRIDNTFDLMVTGVLAEIPEASSLKFDFLINYDLWQKQSEWSKDWGNSGPYCYVLLNPNASLEKVNAKIKNYVKTKDPKSNVELLLQNYGQSYLYSNWEGGQQAGGRIEYVKIFSIVAVFILFIACINFMNLATARSVKRAREIGVRKVVGAHRVGLMGQFMCESMLITFFALILAVVLTYVLLPSFNSLTEKRLSLNFVNPTSVLFLLGLTLLTGLLAGSYPALFMSSLNPVVVLKGALKFKSGATYFRKGLVVFQFGLSIMLILSMIVVSRQIDYIQKKNLGYERENLLYMPLEGELQKNFQTFKRELEKQPGIHSVSCSQSEPLEVGSSTGGVRWPGKDSTQKVLFSQNPVSYDYIKTMGIKLVDGRDFSTSFGGDTSNYIINEAAARKMGYLDPVGKEVGKGKRKGIIVGLMKDFHHHSLHVAIEPLILELQRGHENWGSVLIRVEAGQTRQALKSMENIFKQFNPKFPFRYSFTDQEFANYYKAENTVSNLSNYFGFLAILISCLGLFGLASFMAAQRRKEIGIRKVLGASVSGIIGMLSRDFIQLVHVAALFAFPMAWYFLEGWLEKYAYRIGIEWWYFVAALVAALLVTLLTIIFQSVKAATADPVRSLKTE